MVLGLSHRNLEGWIECNDYRTHSLAPIPRIVKLTLHVVLQTRAARGVHSSSGSRTTMRASALAITALVASVVGQSGLLKGAQGLLNRTAFDPLPAITCLCCSQAPARTSASLSLTTL